MKPELKQIFLHERIFWPNIFVAFVVKTTTRNARNMQFQVCTNIFIHRFQSLWLVGRCTFIAETIHAQQCNSVLELDSIDKYKNCQKSVKYDWKRRKQYFPGVRHHLSRRDESNRKKLEHSQKYVFEILFLAEITHKTIKKMTKTLYPATVCSFLAPSLQ